MYPELLRIGPFVLSSYGLMLVIAFVTAYILINREGKRLGWPPELAQDIVFWAIIGGIIGAKIYFLIENIGRGSGANLAGLWNIIAGLFTLNFQRVADGIQNFGAGLVFFGGFLGGLVAITLLVRRRKISWLLTADVMAPYLILSYAIGRVGCFLAGCCHGIPPQLPWAIAFPNGADPTTVPVHPTQLYEITMGLIIFTFLYRYRLKARFQGQIFSLYLILAGTERFLVEFIRTNQRYFLGLSGAQYFGFIAVVLGGFLVYWLPRRKKVETS